jgi:hypothetical protein
MRRGTRNGGRDDMGLSVTVTEESVTTAKTTGAMRAIGNPPSGVAGMSGVAGRIAFTAGGGESIGQS